MIWALFDLAPVAGASLESIHATAESCAAAAARLAYLSDGLASPICRALGAVGGAA